MKRGVCFGVILVAALILPACLQREGHDNPGDPVAREGQPPGPKGNPQDPPPNNPLGPNAGCYVCHMTFVREELTGIHLKHKIGCVECHGTSEGHANDENIGATSPDKVFPRDRIEPFCLTCHKKHRVDEEMITARANKRSEPEAASLPAGRTATCTDCHGNHRITGG